MAFHLTTSCILLCVFSSVVIAGEDPQQPTETKEQTQRIGSPRKQDEIYLCNTRSLETFSKEEQPALAILRRNEKDQWDRSTVEDFYSRDHVDTQTIIYVHGYDFDAEKAETVGWDIYHKLCDQLQASQHIRYLIWSWPSDGKSYRPRRDFARKAIRADQDACYLAWMVSGIHTDHNVCLIGSALGCRAIEGALHLAGGGELNGYTLPTSRQKSGPKLTTAMIAPAVHSDWLMRGKRHEHALARVEKLLLIVNEADPLLRRYGRVWRSQPDALGFAGLPSTADFGNLTSRIEQLDAQSYVGETHGIEHYMQSPALIDKLRICIHKK